MTIAILTASVSRNAGGLFDAIRRLAAQTAAFNGFSIRVFGLDDSCAPADLPRWQGLPVTTVPVRGPHSFGYAPQLLPALLAAGPDLVHQHGLWMYPSIVCRRWAAGTLKPSIISPHGMLDSWALGNSSRKKRLAGWLYEDRNLRGAACLHALCEAEARAIRAYRLTNPICVIPNGIDVPKRLDAPAPDWEDGGTRGAKVLLYLGRLHPKKNLLNLLRAWANLQLDNQASRQWRLVIAGWDQSGYQAELEHAAHDLEIKGTVRFPGPQFGDAKHATLCRADAFILPSLSEGLPMAVLEAWAYALPVVMTAQCNLPEGFHAGGAIQVQTQGSGIASGLHELFSMSDTGRRQMGTRGRRLVEERFNWPNIALRMKEVYDWVLGGGPKPGSVTIC